MSLETIADIQAWLRSMPLNEMLAMGKRIGMNEWTMKSLRYGKRRGRYETIAKLVEEKRRMERAA